MRLIHTFSDDRKAKKFSHYLTQQGIENQLDITKITDWGSPQYGDLSCKLWIIDEDQVEIAHHYLEEFTQNPYDKKFEEVNLSILEAMHIKQSPTHLKRGFQKKRPGLHLSSRPNAGKMTLFIIILCTVIFLISSATRRPFQPYPSSLPPTPLFSSNIEKSLYFDYPKNFVIIDKLIAAYGFEKVIHPKRLPEDGRLLLNKFFQMDYWLGVYPKLVSYLQGEGFPSFDAPLFEKQREGELWRLVSPCFLHADLIHLFFNMIWLFVIGKQMEKRLKIFRFLLFILLTGVFSNTAQYLMSGAHFVGFSGVLCAMIVFVWMRQKKAPWEGYHLLPSTMTFITAFVAILAIVQFFSFLLEAINIQGFTLPIANTAHLAGALSGYLLAKWNFFSLHLGRPRP